MTTINANTGNPIDTAHHYAEYLASYISDPSTIRSHTLDQFGMAPNMETIQEMRAKVIASRAQPWNAYQLPKYDGSRMDRWVEPSAPKAETPTPFIPRNRPPPITPDEIIADIANECGLSYREVVGRDRARRVTGARFLVAGLMVERGNTAGHVGLMLGGRDRSTIESACEALPARLSRDPALTAIYKKYCALWGLAGKYI